MIEETQVSNEELDTSQTPDEELDLDLTDEEEQDADESKAEDKSEDVEALKAKIAELDAKNKQLYARIKKPDKVEKKPTTNSGLTREEAILFAKGYTEDEVILAVKLSKIAGTNPLVSAEDPYFKSVVATRLKKEKAEQASLGASGGTNKFAPKSVGKMTEEEHQKYFHEVMSRV